MFSTFSNALKFNTPKAGTGYITKVATEKKC